MEKWASEELKHQAIRATQACGTLIVSVKRNPERSARTTELTSIFTLPIYRLTKLL
ncbi:hypothetical protein [Nostoc sp.]|uniref:hypothetical protein n=1 Tax=Nostoc sp. TaxID=1180 RepID=UPI002FF4CA7F